MLATSCHEHDDNGGFIINIDKRIKAATGTGSSSAGNRRYSPSRPIRIVVVLLLSVVISLKAQLKLLQKASSYVSNTAIADTMSYTAPVPSSSSFSSHITENDPDHFTLCGRTLHISAMPHVPPPSTSNLQYGIPNWSQKRTLENAVVLDPRMEKIHGRTGNQIRGFFHAFDYARDRNGPLVIHDTGFPMDSTLRILYMGLENRTELQERLGVLLYDTVDEAYREKMHLLGTRWARDYVSTNEEYTQFDSIQHRHYLIQQLYRMTAKEMELHPNSTGTADMCASFHAYFGKNVEKDGVPQKEEEGGGVYQRVTEKYTIIHSRSFEGKQFLEEAHKHYGVDPHASTDYPPDLITKILAPLGMANNSILMITDGQNTEVIDRLSADPAIGPHFRVVPQEVSTMAGDIMLGILSEVFIGNPASSFSQYITMVRYALGFDHSYLYVRRHPLDGSWETFCSDETCFYQLHDLEAQTHQPGAPKTII